MDNYTLASNPGFLFQVWPHSFGKSCETKSTTCMPATVGVLEALQQKDSQERVTPHECLPLQRHWKKPHSNKTMERGTNYYILHQMSAYNCRGVGSSLSRKTMEMGVNNCQCYTCKARSKTFNIFSAERKQLVGLKPEGNQ